MTTHYRYRVVGSVEAESFDSSPSESFFQDISTDWMPTRERAIKVAEALRDSGHSVQIESREVHTTVDFDEVPE